MDFMIRAGQKLVENCLSIKLWIIVGYMAVSAFFVYIGKLDGVDFATSNGSVISIVLAIREGIKVTKINAIGNGATPEVKDKIEKISV